MSLLQQSIDGKNFDEIKTLLKEKNVTVKEYDEIYTVGLSKKVAKTLHGTKSNDETLLLKQCNNVFISRETNKIVHYFSQIDEICTSQKVMNVASNSMDYRIMPRFEGTLIKVYWMNNEWCIGTNKVPLAQIAFWSKGDTFAEMKSFKELFYECVIENYGSYIEYLSTLDTEYCYTYIIQHPENNLCIYSGTPVLNEINRVNLTTMTEYLNENLFSEKTLSEILSEGALQKTTDNYIAIIYNTNCSYNKFVIDSEAFNELKKLYGNCTNLLTRYIQKYKNSEINESLKQNFKHLKTQFYDIDDDLRITLLQVYLAYHDMHVLKKRVELNGIYKQVLYKLHGHFLKEKQEISLDTIENLILNEYAPKTIMIMIQQDVKMA